MNINTTVLGGKVEKSLVTGDVLTVTLSTEGALKIRSRVEIRNAALVKAITDAKLDRPGVWISVTGKTMIDAATNQLVVVADKAPGSVQFLHLGTGASTPVGAASGVTTPAATTPASTPAKAAASPSAPVATTPAVTPQPVAAPKAAAAAPVAAPKAAAAAPVAATLAPTTPAAAARDPLEPPDNMFTEAGMKAHEDYASTFSDEEAQAKVDALILAGVLPRGTKAAQSSDIPF